MTTTRNPEAGMTLIEVIIACGLLVTLMAGLMSLGGLAISTTENQGHLAARTTEYAQDKMEQLCALAYGDAVTDTRSFPGNNSGGSGLAVRGSSGPHPPVASRRPRRIGRASSCSASLGIYPILCRGGRTSKR